MEAPATFPTPAAADCPIPTLARRGHRRSAYPCCLLDLALVWRAIRAVLLRGRDVVLDSTLLAAWTPPEPHSA